MIVYNYTGYVNRELKEIIVGGIFQGEFFKADASGRDLLCWQRGQGNFELITNFDYIHEGQRTLVKVYVGAGSQSFP